MSIQNKRFQSNENSEVVTVVADNGIFYSLSNGANIKKDIFFQKYSEMIDPTSFFEKQSQDGLAELAAQLKNVDSSKAIDGKFEPQVRYKQEALSEQLQAPPEYREMMLKRFEYEQAHKDLSQYKVYENDDDAAADFERRTQQPQQQQRRQPPPEYQQPQQQYVPQMDQQQQQPIMESNTNIPNAPGYLSPEEESFRFFRSFKRIFPIKLAVDFDEKIAEPNFIKMMAVNYEGDIIKFYTKEIMNRIYNDPGFLENKIYEKLKSLIFEESQEEKPKRVKTKPKEPEVRTLPESKSPKKPKKTNG